MLATCGALGMAFKRMNQRDAIGYQRWLRARVLAQGLTIVAIVVAGVQEVGMGALTGQLKAAQPPATTDHETRGFERRLREAEEAHKTETIVASTGAISPSTGAGSASTTSRAFSDDKDVRPSSAPPSQSSWLSWLGISRR